MWIFITRGDHKADLSEATRCIHICSEVCRSLDWPFRKDSCSFEQHCWGLPSQHRIPFEWTWNCLRLLLTDQSVGFSQSCKWRWVCKFQSFFVSVKRCQFATLSYRACRFLFSPSICLKRWLVKLRNQNVARILQGSSSIFELLPLSIGWYKYDITRPSILHHYSVEWSRKRRMKRDWKDGYWWIIYWSRNSSFSQRYPGR